VIEVRNNLMDRMVAAVSPERGLKRMAARATLAAATSLSSGGSPTEPGGRLFGRGSYNAANSSRRQTRNWFARPRSANADYIGGQKTLVGRSIDAWENMPMGTAAIERRVTFTIGTGLMAIPEIDAAAVGVAPDQVAAIAARIATDYDEYMASTDPDAERTSTGYGLQDVIYRGALLGGDILQVRVMPESQPGRRSSTSWKLYEAHWIVSPMGHLEGEVLTSGEGAGNVCVAGVEMDAYSAPVAFHVLKKDPGSFGYRMVDDTVRIPAWGEKTDLPTAVHIMIKLRAAQARGVPLLAPVLETLKQVSDLTEAELFAAVLTAMLAIIYKSPGAEAMPEPEYGTDPIVTGQEGYDPTPAARSDYRMEAGTTWEIDSDAEVDMKSPGRPNPAFDPFFMGLMRQLSAAIETPVEVLLLHFLSSYTASRAAFETFYTLVRKSREWLASHSESPRYRAWLFEQVARGRYKLPGFLADADKRAAWGKVRFRGDGKISMDPAREAKALEIHEAHGWRTGQEITAELTGGDYDANVTRRGLEHARFIELGLPIPNVVGGGNGLPEATDTTDNIAGSGSGGSSGGDKGGNN